MNWLAALDWSKRPAELRTLRVDDERRPVMDFRPERVTGPWRQLCAAWRRLPAHAALLEPLDNREDGTLVLRYAAIAWEDDKTKAQPHVITTWVGQVVEAYLHIAAHVPAAQWRLFSRPDVHVDIGRCVRIGFLPPQADADGDLAAIASGVITLLTGEEGVRRGRTTLDQIRNELHLQGWPHVRHGARQDGWRLFEEAVGFLLLERFVEAGRLFVQSDVIYPTAMTQWGVDECEKRQGKRPAQLTPEVKSVLQFRPWTMHGESWFTADAKITKLEAERDFAGAMHLYNAVIVGRDNAALIYGRRARCHLELREPGLAIDYARRSLATDPTNVDVRAVLVRALIEHRDHGDALVEADAFIVQATHDAMAHYLRGKALLALGRVEEARDAFVLALVLKPTMAEAVLLRGQAERTLVALGKVVGHQAVTIEIPQSLEPLRAVLTSGRAKSAIEALAAPSLAADADAQLMLARFYSFEAKHDLALAIYDRFAAGGAEPHRRAAVVGKAGVLLDLAMFESALALFDAVIAEAPNDIEAIEGRARTLDKLGRTGEAAAEFRRFVALGSARASLRVRAAQLWLESH